MCMATYQVGALDFNIDIPGDRVDLFFRSLMNAKSDTLDPGIPKRLPQHPVASPLGTEPTKDEIATAIKVMLNAKAVGPDGLTTKLLKLTLQQDRTILLELH